MRAIGWRLVPLLLLACGDPPAAPPERTDAAAWPIDGFLRIVPGNASVTARLPSPARAKEQTAAVAALLACFGYSAETPFVRDIYANPSEAGIDAQRSPGFVVGTDRSWLHLLPAADKGRLNATLRARAGRVAVREEQDWIVVGTGAGPAPGEADPLQPGDAALRVIHHPLLDAVAQPGDRLELGLTLEPGGIELAGALIPGKGSPTSDALRRAGSELSGQIDLLPAWLAVRFESTLPTTTYATFLSRRIALHAGIAEGELRDNMERFLREAATGIDARTGLAVGLDLSTASPNFVAVGRVAEGPASPILAKLQRISRATYGGLVFDRREMKSPSLLGYYAWVPDAKPKEAGLPQTALPTLGALASEDMGVLVTYAEVDGYAIVAAGARADRLARAVATRISSGAQQSAGSRQLAILRERNEATCILSVVVAPSRMAGLVESDVGALRSALGASADAKPPKLIALAGFSNDGRLDLAGRVIYE